MAIDSFTTTISVGRPAHEVFDVINEPRAWWWAELEGRADEIGAEFTFDDTPNHVWRFRVATLDPAEKVVWRVVDSEMTYVQDPAEWTGTEVVFELTEAAGVTTVRFTHVGLTPALECFDSCSAGWTGYVTDSLLTLLTTGKGAPGAY